MKVFLTYRCRSRRLRRQFDAEHSGQSPEQRMLLETVFDEAVTAFQSVLEPQRPPPARTPSRRRPEVAEKATQIRQPPNSPDSVAHPAAVTFTFDHINDSDGFESDVPPPPPNPAVPKVTVASAEVTAEATSSGLQRLRRGRRSLRKRPRKPSFKAHRVPPKFSCCEDADDEASSSGDDQDQVDSAAASIDLVKLQRISIDDDEYDSSSTCSEEIFADSSGLQLRLKVLSEAQRTVEDAASVVTDWAKVGAELRSIADKFGDEADPGHHVDEVDGEGRRVVARHEVDVVSLVNLMLPFSVPQSLWSALVSYAAWKIFKRFQ